MKILKEKQIDIEQIYKDNFLSFSDKYGYSLAGHGVKPDKWTSNKIITFDTESYRFAPLDYTTFKAFIQAIKERCPLSDSEINGLKEDYDRMIITDKMHIGDIGIKPEIHVLAYWALYDGESIYKGKQSVTFIRTLKNLLVKYKRITIIGHNINYDINNIRLNSIDLLSYLEQNGLSLGETKLTISDRYHITSNTVYYIRLTNKQSNNNKQYSLILMSSTNFANLSQDVLTEPLGYYKAYHDYSLAPRDWNKFLDEIETSQFRAIEGVLEEKKLKFSFSNLIESMPNDPIIIGNMPKGQLQCVLDVYNLYQWISDFLKESKKHNLILGFTSAQTSYKTWIGNYLNCNIAVKKSVLKEIMIGYHAGITQAYMLGELHNTISGDFNSLYPSVMATNKHSIRLIEIAIKPDKAYIKNMLEDIEKQNFNFFIKANIRYNKYNGNRITPLVYHNKNKNRRIEYILNGDNLIFTGREIALAIKEGYKIEYNKVWKFENADLFSSFISYFYGLKKNAKTKGERFISKLIQNSSYGKHAQYKSNNVRHSYNEDNLYKQEILSAQKVNARHLELPNGEEITLHNTFYESKTKEKFIHNALISMEITADARIKLYLTQKKIGFDNIAYSDTDSIHMTYNSYLQAKEKYPDLFSDKELGALKIEYGEHGSIIKREIIHNVKDYSLIFQDNYTELKHKGISKKDLKLTGNEVKQFIMSEWRTQKSNSGFNVLETIIKERRTKPNKLDYVKIGDIQIGYPKGLIGLANRQGIDIIEDAKRISKNF